jgi:hypothetical protein
LQTDVAIIAKIVAVRAQGDRPAIDAPLAVPVGVGAGAGVGALVLTVALVLAAVGVGVAAVGAGVAAVGAGVAPVALVPLVVWSRRMLAPVKSHFGKPWLASATVNLPYLPCSALHTQLPLKKAKALSQGTSCSSVSPAIDLPVHGVRLPVRSSQWFTLTVSSLPQVSFSE